MTPDRLRYLLGELGLSQNGLARLAGVNDRTARRWCSGGQEIPATLEAFLMCVTKSEVAEAMGGKRAA